MTKNRAYKSSRYRDLTGGINNRDFPTEIEDKQMLQLSNFNFKWNKLVSWNGVERIFNSIQDSPTQALTVNNTDLYHINKWNLYKNNDLLYKSNDYELKFNSNPDWEIISINIDWSIITFWWFFWNESLYITTLISVISSSLWGDYVVEDKWNRIIWIYKTDYSPISISNANAVKKITLNDYTEYSQISVTIDWVTTSIDWQIQTTAQDWLTHIVSQLNPLDYYFDVSGNELILVRRDWANMTITSTETTNYTYVFRWRSSTITNESEINLWVWGSSSPVKTWKLNWNIDWEAFEYIYPTWQTFTPSTFTYNYSYIHWSVLLWNDNIEEWILIDQTYWNLPIAYITENIVEYPTSGVDRRWIQFNLRKTDLSQITFSYWNTWVKSDWVALSSPTLSQSVFLIETQHNATITVSTHNEITKEYNNIWTELASDDRFSLTVSNYWILIVSKRWFNPVFIDNDWTVNQISTQLVWAPTVGTIYNWRIVLWGYNNSDNIIYSRVDNPLTPTNEILDFSNYSAWAQSVSGWNRWMISWFMVWENWLYVFKTDEVWYTNSEKDTWTSFNFIFNKITSSWAINQECITQVEQEIFYYDWINKAIRRLWYEQNLQTLRDVAVSREVENTLLSIPDDDESADDRYTPLMSLQYSYPNLELNYADWTSPFIFLVGLDENNKFRVPNKTLLYNIYTKSFTTRTDKEALSPIVSSKGYFWTWVWDIYISNSWNTQEEWFAISKEFTFWDDIDRKKLWEIEVSGNIIWANKTFSIWALSEWQPFSIGWGVLEKTITWEWRFETRITTSSSGRSFNIIFKHSWDWYVEINSLNLKWKPLKR